MFVYLFLSTIFFLFMGCLLFELGFLYLTQASLKLKILLSQPPCIILLTVLKHFLLYTKSSYVFDLHSLKILSQQFVQFQLQFLSSQLFPSLTAGYLLLISRTFRAVSTPSLKWPLQIPSLT